MKEYTTGKVYQVLRGQFVVLFYVLQILFIAIYTESEVAPFVYVHF